MRREIKDKIVQKVIEELERAERVFPDFPRDLAWAQQIIAEEHGEVAEALLEGNEEDVICELAQEAAMCFRTMEVILEGKNFPLDECRKRAGGFSKKDVQGKEKKTPYETRYKTVLEMLAQRLYQHFDGHCCPSFKGYITKCNIENGGEKISSFYKCKGCIEEGINSLLKGK
jgi:phosphoribosyl-ATP pyrophosphohydrolase